MALPGPLLLPPPRQPTPEVRAGRAYRVLSGWFMACLTIGIAFFLAPFLPGVPTRLHWPLWALAGAAILAIPPLRTFGIHRGLLSYYVHGHAVEGTVVSVEPAGPETFRIVVRFAAGSATPLERPFTVYDAAEPPLRPGDSVPVLFRPADPGDAVLPTLAGIL